MKHFLCAAFAALTLLLAGPSAALEASDVENAINSTLADNRRGAITAASLRSILLLMSQNGLYLNSDGSIAFPGGPAIGRSEAGKFILTPETIQTADIQAANAAVRAGQTEAVNSEGADLDFRNSTLTAQQMYAPQLPPNLGYFYRDGIRSTVQTFGNDKSTHLSAFGGYVVNNRLPFNSSGQTEQNSVIYWGNTSCRTDYSRCWGGNWALIDNEANGVTSSGVGKQLNGLEIDYSVTSPNTNVQGVTVLLNSSMVNPAGSDGFGCGSVPSSPARWKNCFVVSDGATDRGVYIGAKTPSGVSASADVGFGYRMPDGLVHAVNAFASFDALNVVQPGGGNGIGLLTTASGSTPAVFAAGNSANIDLRLYAAGTGTLRLDSPVSLSQPVTALKPITMADLLIVKSVAFAALPSSGVPPGSVLFCTDCREPGQASGAGTGALVVRNATGWRAVAGGAAAN